MSSPAAIPHSCRLRGSPALIRVLAVFLGLHGVAHFAGTGDSFTAAAEGESVDYLGGTWTLSDPTVLLAMGVVWALVGAAFVGVLLRRRRDRGRARRPGRGRRRRTDAIDANPR